MGRTDELVRRVEHCLIFVNTENIHMVKSRLRDLQAIFIWWQKYKVKVIPSNALRIPSAHRRARYSLEFPVRARHTSIRKHGKRRAFFTYRRFYRKTKSVTPIFYLLK